MRKERKEGLVECLIVSAKVKTLTILLLDASPFFYFLNPSSLKPRIVATVIMLVTRIFQAAIILLIGLTNGPLFILQQKLGIESGRLIFCRLIS
jgi:hypothetical protein